MPALLAPSANQRSKIGAPFHSGLDPLVLRAHRGERLRLLRALRVVGHVGRIDVLQAVARRADQRAKFAAKPLRPRRVGGERRSAGLALLRLEPALQALFLDGDRERLVERRVVLRVDDLMRELVEDQAREIDLAVADERREHRIVEVAQRRIRGNPARVDVESVGREPRRFGARVVLREIAAVGDAARDRVAPALRREREFRRREDVPDDERASDVGVARVAAVVRKRELSATRRRGSPAPARAGSGAPGRRSSRRPRKSAARA